MKIWFETNLTRSLKTTFFLTCKSLIMIKGDYVNSVPKKCNVCRSKRKEGILFGVRGNIMINTITLISMVD